MKTTTSGQELMLSATHSNRTVRLWTDYDVLDQEYKQHSRIELSPTVYIEYNVNLINKTIVINVRKFIIHKISHKIISGRYI